MKVFHYSDIDKWQNIKKDSWQSDDMPGLAPILRVGVKHPEAPEMGGLFAFFEPTPKEWTDAKEFKNTWRRLQDNMGVLLIEVEVDPKDPKAFVFDWGRMEGFLHPSAQMPDRYRHATRLEAESAYFESKVSLERYLKEKDMLGFVLPEVVLTEHVPYERIGISSRQPFIEEMIETNRGLYSREEILRKLKSVSEFRAWLDEYQERVMKPEAGLKLR